MCEESCNDKELLLLIGKDDSLPDEYYLQLYDVEKDEWYPHFTIPGKECDDAGPRQVICPVESKFYFMGKPIPYWEYEKDDGKISYFNFDFATKIITKMGRLSKLGDPWYSDYNVIGKSIYSFSDHVSCFNTEDESMNINCGEFYSCSPGQSVYSNGLVYGFCWNGDFKVYNINTRETEDYLIPDMCLKNSVALLNGQIYLINWYELGHMATYTIDTGKWDYFDTKGPPDIQYGRLIVCNGRLLCVEKRCYIYEYNFDEKKWSMLCNDYNGAICYNFNVFTVKKSHVSSNCNK